MKVILIVLICINVVSAASSKGRSIEKDQGQDGPIPKKKGGDTVIPKIDEATYTKYKDQVCNAVPSFKGGSGGGGDAAKNLTLYDIMSEDEVYELAFLNLAHGLGSDSISHLTVDLGYRKRVLDLITVITKFTCDGEVVPEQYLNVAKNLFLYYVMKRIGPIKEGAKESGGGGGGGEDKPAAPAPGGGGKNATSVGSETWMQIITLLEQCTDYVGYNPPIPISMECDVAAYMGDDVPIAIAEERLDIELGNEGHEFVDEVIDAVWWMFSTSYARCYTMYYPREEWVVSFFSEFVNDFIDPFLARWRDPGPMAAYFPIIFGPFDFRRARANLRACNGAAYQMEGIPERQLVRPMLVAVDGVTVLNFKTGISETRRRKK